MVDLGGMGSIEIRYIATIFFVLAVLHTFAAKFIHSLAKKCKPGSFGEKLFHFLGEVEIIFGIWSLLFIAVWSLLFGWTSAIAFLQSVDYTEAVFVFAIMCMSATRPVLDFCRERINGLASIIPLPFSISLYAVTLTIGPLLGSLITEPAAMTVTAFLLKENFFDKPLSLKFKYATLALLFVNVSIGGTLTHFAAPPVLMVAAPWGWTSIFMLTTFGPRVIPAIMISTLATAWFFRRELVRVVIPRLDVAHKTAAFVPFWVIGLQIVFMAAAIAANHHMLWVLALFLGFLGWCLVTKKYQDQLKIKESFLVAVFLGGLITLGKLQDWWLKPLLSQLGPISIFLGATGLTSVVDNAAITYLGTLVESLSDEARYLLVAGAVTGGGLTVIANAPNPAGYSILQKSFDEDGINPMPLFLGALPYTVVVAIIFLLF